MSQAHSHRLRPFSCNVCNKKFTGSGHLKYHMQMHNDERPFSCKVCSKKFPYSSDLNCHKRIHIGYVLSVAMFVTRSLLSQVT